METKVQVQVNWCKYSCSRENAHSVNFVILEGFVYREEDYNTCMIVSNLKKKPKQMK
jgi:hypothetical protein